MTPPDKTTVSWTQKIRGYRLAEFWAVAAILGAAFLFIFPDQSVSRLIIPVVVMLWFCVAGYRSAKTTAQPALRSTQIAQLADSVYFLGFIWTLVALIDAFVFKRLKGAEGVFSIFGYALVTTASGLFLRMFLLQFMYRAHGQASEAHLTVEEQLERFTSRMEAALKSLQNFNDASSTTSRVFEGLKPSLEEFKTSVTGAALAVAAGAEDVRQATTSGAEYVRQETTAGVGEVQEATRSGKKKMDEMIELGVAKVITSLSVLSSQIEMGANVIEEKLTHMASRIDQIRVPADIVAKTAGLSATVQAVETALAGLSTVLESNSVPLALTGLSSRIHTGGGGVQKELEDFAGNMHQLRLPESFVAKVDEFNSAVAGIHAAIVALGKVLGSGSNEIGLGAKTVETTLSEFADDVRKIRLPKDTVMKTEELARRLQEFEGALSEIVGIVRQQTQRLSYSAIHVIHSGDL